MATITTQRSDIMFIIKMMPEDMGKLTTICRVKLQNYPTVVLACFYAGLEKLHKAAEVTDSKEKKAKETARRTSKPSKKRD